MGYGSWDELKLNYLSTFPIRQALFVSEAHLGEMGTDFSLLTPSAPTYIAYTYLLFPTFIGASREFNFQLAAGNT